MDGALILATAATTKFNPFSLADWSSAAATYFDLSFFFSPELALETFFEMAQIDGALLQAAMAPPPEFNPFSLSDWAIAADRSLNGNLSFNLQASLRIFPETSQELSPGAGRKVARIGFNPNEITGPRLVVTIRLASGDQNQNHPSSSSSSASSSSSSSRTESETWQYLRISARGLTIALLFDFVFRSSP